MKQIRRAYKARRWQKVVLGWGDFAPGFLMKEFDMNTTKMSKLTLVIGSFLMAGGAMAAYSGIGTMGVTAEIGPECAVGNTVPLAFGYLAMLTAAGAPITTSTASTGGTFDAICTNGTQAPELRFTSANTASSSFRMVGTDGSTYIVYTLKESGGTAIAHNTNAAFTGLAADGTTKPLQVVGTIAAADKSAKLIQNYSDTITITSSYTP